MAKEYVYIFKYPRAGGQYNGMWGVEKGHYGEPPFEYEMLCDEILFRAKTRKECRQYCEYNGQEITYMDTGREHGCRW